jgi:hypothetical protein
MPWVFDRRLEGALGARAGGRGRILGPAGLRLAAVLESRLDLTAPAAAVESLLLDVVELRGHRFHTGQSFIGAGDWSRVLLPFARHQISREALELKAAGLRFRDTRCVRRLPTPRRRPASPWCAIAWCSTRRRRWMPTSRASSRSSSRSPSTACADATDFAARSGWRAGRRRWLAELGEQDIGVALTADGHLVKLPGGQHRFAIARALGLGEVPVQLRLLHVDALQGMSAPALIDLIDTGRAFQLCNIDAPRSGRIMPAS